MIVYDINALTDKIEGSALTIGNFDGVHVGHQQLIQQVRKRGRRMGLSSIVVTFDPHPLRVLVGKKTPPFITLNQHKLELMQELGVDYILCMTFNKDIASMEPEDFVYDFLVKKLRLRELIVGYDYVFGKNRRGNFHLLQQLGQKYGFSVDQFMPVMVDGAIVSSTRIRDLVESGRVWEVHPLLGRFYSVEGRVTTGRQRGGSLLGFPTANILLQDELFPSTGVYAVWAEISGSIHAAVANIGYNPTFGNDYLSVEVHIFDFHQDVYNHKVKVHFVQRLRSEKKFAGIEELKSQITLDCKLAREILKMPEAKLC
ncbi:riboflavin biosynthesis protein RibF [Desulfonatronospira thiodismutans ASO3-1]|uniref:Riboflavin biosynthesis protein n=1 Tax=Desulfonatronospira thiodismutans ASO3-1 TaxID=555779 RepID=D6SS40_9BACT|nr:MULTISPECIES: bifunctional riboflavin kinase/FAD synthetase [Desulfonatronospira]EFI33506.1 riboflavin biosynthesis protein RibF [Desulfonatronospira thiodismutans ASO3-1]RQD74824.1 MAG: bifunctional riboflavin kinase/FAD synthetase [Desulfonatronospira sp. MSAO_Bac3]